MFYADVMAQVRAEMYGDVMSMLKHRHDITVQALGARMYRINTVQHTGNNQINPENAVSHSINDHSVVTGRVMQFASRFRMSESGPTYFSNFTRSLPYSIFSCVMLFLPLHLVVSSFFIEVHSSRNHRSQHPFGVTASWLFLKLLRSFSTRRSRLELSAPGSFPFDRV